MNIFCERCFGIMLRGQVIVNVLRYEQRPVSPSNLGLKTTLWNVYVDDSLYSDTMLPFNASDEYLETRACQTCGMEGCGEGTIRVRRFNDVIAWIQGSHFEDSKTEIGKLIFSFDKRSYQTTLGGSTEGIPVLSNNELKQLAYESIPPSSMAVYREPADDKDPTGAGILSELKRIVSPDATVKISFENEYPYGRLAIGLDLPEFPELTCDVSSKPLKIRFVSNPSIPAWFECSEIESQFWFPVTNARETGR